MKYFYIFRSNCENLGYKIFIRQIPNPFINVVFISEVLSVR